MKILYIDHAPYEGGAEVSLKELIRELSAEQLKISLIAPPNAPYVDKDKVLHLPLTFHWKNYRLILPMLFDAALLTKRIWQVDPDIIHTNTRVTNILASFLYKLKLLPPESKLINHVRDKDPLPSWKFKLIGLADQLIANSRRVKKFLVEGGIPKKKIEVIYNGVDLTRFTPTKVGDEIDPRSWHDLVITSIGQIYSRKGFRYLIEAMGQVVAEFPGTRLQIVGEDPTPNCTNLKQLKLLTERLGLQQNIQFLGYRQDIPQILAQTDVFVLPSLEEPFGRVIIEAMAVQLPVVATRVGGVPEIVVEGKTGFLVGPKDADALAVRMTQLLQDPNLREQMGINGRERVEENFSLRRHVDAVRLIYDKLLGG